MEHKVIRCRYHFTGMVQGVGFRYRARYAAQLLELTGWVENEADGSVTGEVQGLAEMVARWVPTILAGSSWIEIETMDRKDLPLQPHEYGFSVRGY